MKQFSVEISPRGLRDLERAKREVFDASQSESVTVDYLRRIAAEIDSLSTMPSRFPFWKTSKKLQIPDHREIPRVFPNRRDEGESLPYSLRRAKAVSRISLEHDGYTRGDF